MTNGPVCIKNSINLSGNAVIPNRFLSRAPVPGSHRYADMCRVYAMKQFEVCTDFIATTYDALIMRLDLRAKKSFGFSMIFQSRCKVSAKVAGRIILICQLVIFRLMTFVEVKKKSQCATDQAELVGLRI